MALAKIKAFAMLLEAIVLLIIIIPTAILLLIGAIGESLKLYIELTIKKIEMKFKALKEAE